MAIKRIRILLLVTMMSTVNVLAQTENAPKQEASTQKGGVLGFVKKIGTFIDSMAIKGLDHRYIESPKKPWQIIVQSNLNQSDLKMKTLIDGNEVFDETWGEIKWEPRIKTNIATYAGIWAGYRGYGLGYSKNIAGDKGSILKFGATGGSYGVNLRIHQFQTDEPEVHLDGYMPTRVISNYRYQLVDPIKVRLMTLDAYYMFNGKKFSYCAAYDQSVIQKRSAGSLMAGAFYYHSTMSYNTDLNANFIMLMDDIGKMKQYQLSVGGGYAYNLVPCKGLLVSGMAMVLLTVYNRLDVWRYDSKLRQVYLEARKNPSEGVYFEEDEDYEWNEEDVNELERELFTIWPMENNYKTTQHGSVIPVIDARLSVTYNIGNWFLNANAQLHNFRFDHHRTEGSLTDWYVNTSVGLRL